MKNKIRAVAQKQDPFKVVAHWLGSNSKALQILELGATVSDHANIIVTTESLLRQAEVVGILKSTPYLRKVHKELRAEAEVLAACIHGRALSGLKEWAITWGNVGHQVKQLRRKIEKGTRRPKDVNFTPDKSIEPR